MAGKSQQQPVELPPTEPVMVPMMVGWPVLVICGIFTVAGVFQAANTYSASGPFSPYWLGLIGVVGTVVAAREARMTYHPRVYGNLQADLATVVSTLLGLGTTAWWVWTGHVGVVDTWAHLILMGLLGTLLWWALLWNGARLVGLPSPVEPKAAPAVSDIDWPAVLAKVDKGRHEVVTIEEHRAGVALVCHPRDVDDETLPTYKAFMGLADPFATRAAIEVRKRGGKLPVNAVRTAPGDDDAEYRIEITTRDVFQGTSVPYVEDYQPGDICNALDLGEYEDASRILIKMLYRHTQIVGATDAGKSVLANNIIARITGCGNALVWVGATDKLTGLVWPWLRCFFEGKASRPVLDWVAGMDPDEVLRMLACAYKLACDRNAVMADDSKIRPTPAMPAVFVILEETSHAMEFGNWIITHDGIKANVSKLIKLIVRAGRSAGVHVVLMAQTALNEAFGQDAPTIKRQLTNRFCLRTNEPYDGHKTLSGLSGNINTTQLWNNTMLCQFLPDGATVARAVPGKAALLDGTVTISHIAERHATWVPKIEPGIDLGEMYAQRWDESRLPNIAFIVKEKGLTWRTPGGGTYQPPTPAAPPTTEPAEPVEKDTAEPAVCTPDDVPDVPSPDTEDPVRDLFDDIMRHFRVDDPRKPKTRPDPDPPRAGETGGHGRTVLGLPDPEDSKLFATLDDIKAHPKGVEKVRDEPTLPEPVATLRIFLRQADPSVRFFLTSELAEACGYESTAQMGLDIYGKLKINSRNPRVDERRDSRNKGYSRRELHEAIERFRFGM
jgi:hypothetical protein